MEAPQPQPYEDKCNKHLQQTFNKKCCISKYEKAARILQDIYNQKNVDYTIPGARVVEDSILEYEGPQEKLKNKHDKDIIEKIIELSEKEEIRKKP